MPCRLKWATTLENYRMTTIDATLRGALEVSGRDLILTLDPALQGLPETAHGGSVLAVFDALANASPTRPSRHASHALAVTRRFDRDLCALRSCRQCPRRWSCRAPGRGRVRDRGARSGEWGWGG